MAQGSGDLVKLEDFDGEVFEHWQGAVGKEVVDKNGDSVGTVEDVCI